MLFNSVVFLVFAALFFSVWPAARRRPGTRYGLLIASSAVFYGWWDWRFLFLLFVPGIIDFYLVRAMASRPRAANLLFAASLVLNLGSLAVFKYSGWLADLLQDGLALAGVDADLRGALPEILLVLPIGISFYTFQALTYTIDVHNGRLRPTRSLPHYLAFKSMFPLLLAGPIMRADELLPQLATAREPTADDRWNGLKLIVFGFFQKLVIADGLAPYVNEAFAARTPADSCLFWWIIIVAYAIQIYCDFGGYSNIACGLGRWLGYDLTQNFRHPYLATSLREFWTRWHVSLTNWIWRYVFTPLTYRLLRLVARRNLATVDQEMRIVYPAAAVIAMLLCGLWHGAGLTFLVWGGLHGVLLAVERLTNAPKHLRRLPRGHDLATAVTVLQVALCWVVFRAGSLAQAGTIFERLFGFSGGLRSAHAEIGGFALVNIGILATIAVGREIWHRYGIGEQPWLSPALRARCELVAVALLIPACIYLRGPGTQFIYFQF